MKLTNLIALWYDVFIQKKEKREMEKILTAAVLWFILGVITLACPSMYFLCSESGLIEGMTSGMGYFGALVGYIGMSMISIALLMAPALIYFEFGLGKKSDNEDWVRFTRKPKKYIRTFSNWPFASLILTYAMVGISFPWDEWTGALVVAMAVVHALIVLVLNIFIRRIFTKGFIELYAPEKG